MNLRLGDIDDSIQAFLVRANRQVEESQAKANDLRGRLDQLLNLYAEYGEPPASIEEIRGRPHGPSTNGGLPPETPMLAPAEKHTVPLVQMIHDETLMRIWDWPEWKSLLEAGRADGFIDCSTVGANGKGDDDDEPIWESA